MSEVYIRFHGELNDFLAPQRRHGAFATRFRSRTTVKDMIESLGVPHTEVALATTDNRPLDLSAIVHEHDRIDVYPHEIRPRPGGVPHFILDTHLGKLARYLRLLGFDTLYNNRSTDAELAAVSAWQQRILLTRDKGLLKRREVNWGCYVRAIQPEAQVVEILQRFAIVTLARPFERCIDCNGELCPASLEQVAHRIPKGVVRDFDEFSTCANCKRVYWRGSHYDRLRSIVARLLSESGGACPS